MMDQENKEIKTPEKEPVGQEQPVQEVGITPERKDIKREGDLV